MINNETIQEVTRRLINTYNPLEIYVFGSYAWGMPDEDSDLDLLVVVDSLENERQRHRALVDGYTVLADLRISKDILLFTKQEFDQKVENATTLIYKIKSKGKQIYARA
ncbi:MAG: nucleotidyltransferase domain-containing protein [Candidatus Babeliales bacterium]|nr:nucleotidyltransferase domain-containing protein [Candidatus Babeliales bacterium]